VTDPRLLAAVDSRSVRDSVSDIKPAHVNGVDVVLRPAVVSSFNAELVFASNNVPATDGSVADDSPCVSVASPDNSPDEVHPADSPHDVVTNIELVATVFVSFISDSVSSANAADVAEVDVVSSPYVELLSSHQHLPAAEVSVAVDAPESVLSSAASVDKAHPVDSRHVSEIDPELVAAHVSSSVHDSVPSADAADVAAEVSSPRVELMPAIDSEVPVTGDDVVFCDTSSIDDVHPTDSRDVAVTEPEV
jgi:hypothetical protein